MLDGWMGVGEVRRGLEGGGMEEGRRREEAAAEAESKRTD